MGKIEEIERKYLAELEQLRGEYQRELPGLNDFRPEKRQARKGLLQKKYIEKLQTVQQKKNEELKAAYSEALQLLQGRERGTIKDLDQREVDFIKMAMDTKSPELVQKVANRYADNQDVRDLVRATIRDWGQIEKTGIEDVLAGYVEEIRDIERELQNIGFMDVVDQEKTLR